MGQNRRLFKIQDGVIVVAACATVFACFQAIYPSLVSNFFRQRWTGVRLVHWLIDISDSAHVLSGCLMCVSFAVVLLRFVQPRPSLRRITAQPGFVACFAASIMGGVVILFVAARKVGRLLGGWNLNTSFWELTTPALSSLDSLGRMIVGVWIMLRLMRRPKPESDWVERIGQVVGVLWIVQWLLARGIQVVSMMSNRSLFDDGTY